MKLVRLLFAILSVLLLVASSSKAADTATAEEDKAATSETTVIGVDGRQTTESAPSPGQPLLDDTTFLKKTADGLAFVPSGYKVCKDRTTGQESIACGAAPCPPGMSMIAWNPGDHPSCDGGGNNGTECVDMIQLGWTGGHKQRFCRRRGYEGAQPYPGKKYGAGGMCWRNGAPEDCL